MQHLAALDQGAEVRGDPLVGADGYAAILNLKHELAAESGLPEWRIEHLLGRYGSAITEITGASGIVGTAMQGAGTGYVWGGTAFGAWDCSGFTGWVYAQNGIDIPRTVAGQKAAVTPVSDP